MSSQKKYDSFGFSPTLRSGAMQAIHGKFTNFRIRTYLETSLIFCYAKNLSLNNNHVVHLIPGLIHNYHTTSNTTFQANYLTLKEICIAHLPKYFFTIHKISSELPRSTRTCFFLSLNIPVGISNGKHLKRNVENDRFFFLLIL